MEPREARYSDVGWLLCCLGDPWLRIVFSCRSEGEHVHASNDYDMSDQDAELAATFPLPEDRGTNR